MNPTIETSSAAYKLLQQHIDSLGHRISDTDVHGVTWYYCEYCHRSHTNKYAIEHDEDCFVAQARAVLHAPFESAHEDEDQVLDDTPQDLEQVLGHIPWADLYRIYGHQGVTCRAELAPRGQCITKSEQAETGVTDKDTYEFTGEFRHTKEGDFFLANTLEVMYHPHKTNETYGERLIMRRRLPKTKPAPSLESQVRKILWEEGIIEAIKLYLGKTWDSYPHGKPIVSLKEAKDYVDKMADEINRVYGWRPVNSRPFPWQSKAGFFEKDFECTGEFRAPDKGEYYLMATGFNSINVSFGTATENAGEFRLIFRKK